MTRFLSHSFFIPLRPKGLYRPDIDGLRAFSIVSVVVYHFFPTLLPGGFIGVDIFFVISGYLISGILMNALQGGTFSLWNFYVHRIRRIFPALILVLMAVLFLGWLILPPDDLKRLGLHMAAGAGFVQNIILWRESGYFDVSSELKPLLHLWSLAIEEQFYLLYPLALWGVWKLRLRFTLFIGAALIVSFLLNLWLIGQDPVATFFLPHTRFWELLAGGLLAAIQRQAPWALTWLAAAGTRLLPQRFREPVAARSALSLLALLLLEAGLFIIHDTRPFPGIWAVMPVLGACMMIAAGPEAWVNSYVLSNRVSVFVGLISYPLYLWHWPLLAFARIAEGRMPSDGVCAALLLLAVFLAYGTYRFIEKPIRFGHAPFGKPVILSASLAALALLGIVVFRQDGMLGTSPLRDVVAAHAQFGWGRNGANDTCFRAYPEFKRGHCVLSKPAAPNIIVIGDSHANSLMPGLIAMAEADRQVVLNLAMAACPPLIGVDAMTRGGKAGCALIPKSLALAEQTPEITTIVLAARWTLYTIGTGVGDDPLEVRHDRVLKMADGSSETDFYKVFEHGLRLTFERLVRSGKRIVIVQDVPELGFHPKDCIDAWKGAFGRVVRAPCSRSRTAFDERIARTREVIARVAGEFSGVTVADAAAPLCDANECIALKDGKILYRDADHLSLYGSSLVARSLWPAISGK